MKWPTSRSACSQDTLLASREARGSRLEPTLGPSQRPRALQKVCTDHDIRHKFIKPHRPWQNGEVERYSRTLATEWAYRRACTSNTERREALARWLEHYNARRRHSTLGGHPPTRCPTPRAERVQLARGGLVAVAVGLVTYVRYESAGPPGLYDTPELQEVVLVRFEDRGHGSADAEVPVVSRFEANPLLVIDDLLRGPNRKEGAVACPVALGMVRDADIAEEHDRGAGQAGIAPEPFPVCADEVRNAQKSNKLSAPVPY